MKMQRFLRVAGSQAYVFAILFIFLIVACGATTPTQASYTPVASTPSQAVTTSQPAYQQSYQNVAGDWAQVPGSETQYYISPQGNTVSVTSYNGQ